MSSPLYLDDTPIALDKPCSRCRTLGSDTVCLRQLRDPKNLSCLGRDLPLPERLSEGRGPWSSDRSKSLTVWSSDCSKDDVARRSEDGCHLCTLFVDIYTKFEEFGVVTPKLSLSKQRKPRGGLARYLLEFDYLGGGLELLDAGTVENYSLTSSTGSQASLRRVKNLLKLCVEHKACERRWAEQNNERHLPTRLIDLSMIARNGTISVIDGSTLPAETIYMTLSHCWGPQIPQDAVWHSRDNLAQGLLIDCLPLTFREACLAVVSLDCNYLWIDALCILQGDEADWLRESTQMSDVFSMTALTVAASESDNVGSGLFRRRQLTTLSQFHRKFSCLCAEAILVGYNDNSNYWCRPERDVPPLHRRGWVTQEMALSTRVAYFTSTGIYWICEENEANELRTIQRQAGWPYAALPRSIKPEPPSNNDTWIALVADYSTSLLSYDNDRLVALSGLARGCQVRSKGEMGRYCAGLWESDLHVHLSWQMSEEVHHRTARRPTDYPSPSWSWASTIHTSVYWMDQSLSGSCFKLVEIDVNPVLDTFGVVHGGRLRVKTPLISFQINVDVVDDLQIEQDDLRFEQDELRRITQDGTRVQDDELESELDQFWEERDAVDRSALYDQTGTRIYPTATDAKGGTRLFARQLHLQDSHQQQYSRQVNISRPQRVQSLKRPQQQIAFDYATHNVPSSNFATTRGVKYNCNVSLSLDDATEMNGPIPFQPSPVIIMPTGRAPDRPGYGPMQRSYGLILKNVTGRRGTYQRTGLATFRMSRRGQNAWVRRTGLPISEEMHLGQHNDGRYVIDII